MCLIRRRSPRTQLLQREHQLDRIEQPDDPRQPRRGQTPRNRTSSSRRHRHRQAGARSPCPRAPPPRPQPRDRGRSSNKVIERIPILLTPAVELDDPPSLDDERRHRIVRAVHRDETELDERLDRELAAQAARLPSDEPGRALVRLQAALARHRPSPPRERMGGGSRAPLVEPLRPRLELRRRRAPGTQRRIDLEIVSSGKGASSAARRRLSASWTRPAARATSACIRKVSGVARSSAVSTPSPCNSSSSSAIPPGVRTRSGRFAPSG